ncbi:MAG: hypothetical protein E2P02_03620 [Acidobacteria bacterium]|nr:MAG: hypothetical protein E2P02_03620 [Acidobacteriota bacterium]
MSHARRDGSSLFVSSRQPRTFWRAATGRLWDISNRAPEPQYALTVSNGKTATIGFCWGGGESFRYAVNQPELDAAIQLSSAPAWTSG